MEKVWVLTTKTSLPGVCHDSSDLVENFEVYSSFEKAKKTLFDFLKGHITEENEMFYDDGTLKMLDVYIEQSIDKNDEEMLEIGEDLFAIRDLLKKAFIGEDISSEATKNYSYWDGMIEARYADGILKIEGVDDGPCNGVDPVIETNIFDMSEDKHYYIRIDDMFGYIFGQDASSKLYIDLASALLR